MRGIIPILMLMTLTLMQGHSGSAEENNILSYGIQTAHDGRLTHDIIFIRYAHARFYDLDLDFENVCIRIVLVTTRSTAFHGTGALAGKEGLLPQTLAIHVNFDASSKCFVPLLFARNFPI